MATTRIYGDNVGKSINSLENQIDALYNNPNFSADSRNYAVSLLMRKLENLNLFRKRKLGGLYRISRPPPIVQNLAQNRAQNIAQNRLQNRARNKAQNRAQNRARNNDDIFPGLGDLFLEPDEGEPQSGKSGERKRGRSAVNFLKGLPGSPTDIKKALRSNKKDLPWFQTK